MKNLSFKNILEIIYNTISSSPTTLIFIILGIAFLIAMIYSIKHNKKMHKPLFISGWIFVLAFLLFRYVSYLSTLVDNLINSIFVQIFFPNFAIFVIMIIASNVIFLVSMFKAKTKKSDRIINAIFYVTILVLLILILEYVATKNINVYDRLTTFSDKNLLSLIQASTLTFTLWMTVKLCKLIVRKLIRKSDDNVRDKFVPKSDRAVEVLKL